jgi:hypothetical protein
MAVYIKMDVQEVGCEDVDCIDLPVVKTAISLWVK